MLNTRQYFLLINFVTKFSFFNIDSNDYNFQVLCCKWSFTEITQIQGSKLLWIVYLEGQATCITGIWVCYAVVSQIYAIIRKNPGLYNLISPWFSTSIRPQTQLELFYIPSRYFQIHFLQKTWRWKSKQFSSNFHEGDLY